MEEFRFALSRTTSIEESYGFELIDDAADHGAAGRRRVRRT